MHKVISYINQGRYAGIFSATLEDGTLIAVKQNKSYQNAVKVAYFKQECKIMKSLNHPNINKYIGEYWDELQLELMDGDLAVEYFHPYFDNKKCMLDIAMGLNYIHTLEIPIIHRDIKIENMLVKKIGGVVERTVIADFGFAVVSNLYSDINRTGTPIYMAYEIIKPVRPELIYYTTATDMWAFGILCWHLITKKSIYPGISTLKEYRDLIIRNDRADFSEINGDKKLFNMIEQCWKVDPTVRPKAYDFINYLNMPIYQ